MITVQATLVSQTPISFSRPLVIDLGTGKAASDIEEHWFSRAHIGEDGNAFIPPQAVKNALGEVAKYLQEKVPGKGNATYTKNFQAGTLVVDPIVLHGCTEKTVRKDRLFLPSNPQKKGARVWKNFPTWDKWKGDVSVILLDPLLESKDGVKKVHEYLVHAGMFIGLGRFRPRNNGYYGRFTVENFRVAGKA